MNKLCSVKAVKAVQTNVPKNFKNPHSVSTGENHFYLLDDEGVKCWGDNIFDETNVPTSFNPVKSLWNRSSNISI